MNGDKLRYEPSSRKDFVGVYLNLKLEHLCIKFFFFFYLLSCLTFELEYLSPYRPVLANEEDDLTDAEPEEGDPVVQL